MDKKLLQELKEALEKERGIITQGLEKFATKDPNLKGDWDTSFPRLNSRANSSGSSGSLEEAADEVEEYSNTLPIEHSMELKLKKINSALEKIKNGTYGLCQKCGKPIPEDRIKISPEAQECNQCQ